MALCSSRIRALFGATALSLAASLPASAGLVTLETVESSSVFGTPDFSSPVSIESPVDVSARAGPFRVNNLTTAEMNLVAWCIELTQRFGVGQTQYHTGLQLVSSERLNLLDRLFTQYFPSVQSAVTGAAMQIAVWEIVTETKRDMSDALKLNVHKGNFVVEVDTPTQLANTWLQDISGDPTAGGYVFDFYSSSSKQDLMVARTSTPTLEPIPLPAAAWMLLSAVGGVAGMRKLRKAA